tara:strand:- start:99 stop:716 length:618 start_codon:yes stop_codon:yes gene_type:complete
MRKKLFYTSDEITTNLYTPGKEWMYEDGTEYIGSYHLYSTSEVYTKGTWSSKQSIKLIPYVRRDVLNNVYRTLKTIKIKTKSIPSHKPNVIQSDIKNGYIVRYFFKKINEEIIIEVSADTYKQWKQGMFDKKLYLGIQLNWYITGDIEDNQNGSILNRGVITQNTRQIKAAQSTIPTINNILNNPLDLYVDTNFIVPGDINDSAI